MNTLTINKNKVKELHQNYDEIVNREEGIARDIAFQAFQVKGANAINDLIASDEMDPNIINLVLGSLIDLQVRDYAVGITDESNRDKLINIWSELAKIAPKGAIAPVATLCAIANYESGNVKTALEWLSSAQSDESDYPLAKLVGRVIEAGWGSEQFSVMRQQLHPKVVAHIYGLGNEDN